MEKKYKSYRQLLTIMRSRGIEIKKGSQGSKVIEILKKENYYNVINGYKNLFLDTKGAKTRTEKYKTGTSFDEIYHLYKFDREIRHIHLKYLLQIENTLKTVISHSFSNKYGYDNYLKLSNFESGASSDIRILKKIANENKLDLKKELSSIKRISAEQNTESVIKLIGDIQQEIARQMNKHHQVVTHYMINHGYIPLWVLVNVLSFGKITNFYFNMKPADKVEISKQFGVQEKELHKYMTMLGLARNKCAHDERFFDIEFKQRLHTKSIKNFSALGLTPSVDGSYVSGTNDSFAIAIIFSKLLPKSDLNSFVLEMKDAFKKLSNRIKTVSIKEIREIMGYPDTWENIKKLNS